MCATACHAEAMIKWFRRHRGGSAQPTWDEHAARVGAAAEDRRRRLAGQEEVVRKVEALLFKSDPIGINFEANTDEYRPEAETITLRRAEANTVGDLTRIVHQEFVRWFGEETAGPETAYEAIARDIWTIWSGEA
jgi:hypothetical protein